MWHFGNKEDREINKAIKRLDKLDDNQQEAFAAAAISERFVSVKLRAVSRLSNQMLLAKVAIKSAGSVRMAVLEKLVDEEALVYAAQKMELANDYYTATSEELLLFQQLRKLRYQSFSSIYRTAIDGRIRDEAEMQLAKRTTDKDELITIAKTGDFSARCAAIKRLSNQEVLYEIARYDKDDQIASDAVERLTSAAQLVDIACHSESCRVRETAVRSPYFTDQKTLADIAVNDGDYGVRQMAYRNPNLKAPELLAYVFRECKDVCQRDIYSIRDTELLEDIAKHAKNIYNQKAALYQIKGWENMPWAVELNTILLLEEAKDKEDSRMADIMSADSY